MEATTLPSQATTLFLVNDEAEGWSLGAMVIIALVIFIIACVTVVGNICTILAFLSDVKLHTTLSNYYIFNLAITDLVIGFIVMPVYTVYTVMNYTWPFGRIFCKVYMLLVYVVFLESSLTIMCISADRLLMVKLGPGVYPRVVTRVRTLVVIGVTWLISALVYGPVIIALDLWRGYSIVPDNDCYVEFFDNFTITASASIFEFFTPSISIMLLNSLLYIDIRRRTRAARQDDQKSLRRDLKAAKSLAMIVSTFVVCWSPYTACALLMTICPSCVKADVYNFFIWLLCFNSSINPMMYAASNPRFRRHYQRMLGCTSCIKRQSRIEPSVNTVNSATL